MTSHQIIFGHDETLIKNAYTWNNIMYNLIHDHC